MARLLATFIEYYRAHIADLSRPYPGVIEALDVLEKQGARFAVVTNKYAMLSVEVLQALDLHRYFEAIIGGDTLPQRKPDPAPALHACKLIGCAPAETLFVGDSSTDVETARAAGCPVVCVRDGYNHGAAAESLGADAVIDSFLDLL